MVMMGITVILTGCGTPSQPVPETLDPNLPAIPDPPEFSKLAEGYSFLEGPAWDGERFLYFSDIPTGRILRYDAKRKSTSVFRDNLGRTNGLMFDENGQLVICEQENRRLTRLEGRKVVPLATHWNEKRFNSPNDLVITSDGGIYFTDPAYGRMRELMQLSAEAVYYLSPEGDLRQVENQLVRPNGLILSPDGATLYIADHGARNIWKYSIGKGGQLTQRKKFADMAPTGGGGDGMAVDRDGHIYCAGQGHIWQWAPDGTLLRKIPVPETPTNLTFGGLDGRELFVTTHSSLFSIRTNTRNGRP